MSVGLPLQNHPERVTPVTFQFAICATAVGECITYRSSSSYFYVRHANISESWFIDTSCFCSIFYNDSFCLSGGMYNSHSRFSCTISTRKSDVSYNTIYYSCGSFRKNCTLVCATKSYCRRSYITGSTIDYFGNCTISIGSSSCLFTRNKSKSARCKVRSRGYHCLK